MIDTSPPVPTVPAPTAPAPTVTPQVEPHTKASVSEREAAAMAEWAREDVAKGKLTPEQAAKIFDDLGTPIDQRVTPAETRSDEQKLLDAHFPPATPDEFVIRYGVAGQELPMTPELKQ